MVTISNPPDQYELMLNNYSSILEKTNQQLSLWYNPYGLMIGVLTLIVAVGAIIVSAILINNSSEQKRRQSEFFEEQEKIIREKSEKDDRNRKKANKAFEILIEEQKAELASAASENNKKEIRRAIEKLKIEQANIGAYTGPAMTASNGMFAYTTNVSNIKSMMCTKCGKSFRYYGDGPMGITSVVNFSQLSDKQVCCAHCGAVNIAQ